MNGTKLTPTLDKIWGKLLRRRRRGEEQKRLSSST